MTEQIKAQPSEAVLEVLYELREKIGLSDGAAEHAAEVGRGLNNDFSKRHWGIVEQKFKEKSQMYTDMVKALCDTHDISYIKKESNMIIEVEIVFTPIPTESDGVWDVNVYAWNGGCWDHVDELEREFNTAQEASDYADVLVLDKRYTVTRILPKGGN